MEKSPEVLFNETLGINGETVEGKWTKAVLNKSEISLINKIISHESVHKFKTIATVDVGIVTGANKFFLVDNETVETYNLSAYAHPMFGKSQHCPGILYDENQHKSNQLNNLPTNFLYIESDYNELPLSVQNYIQLGEQEKLNERYKCRIRKPWYKVPSIYSTEIGMLKRCHEALD